MKKILILLLLFVGLSIRAQEQYDHNRYYHVALSYQFLQEKNFTGLELDLTPKVWRKANHLAFGFGAQSGLWVASSQQESTHILEVGYTQMEIPAQSSGTFYYIPASAYFLMGYNEDFLDLGANAQFLMYDSTKQFDFENERYTYKSREFTPLVALHAGYRHQPIESGIYFRVLWLPTFEVLNGTFHHSYRVSLGYSFKG